MKKQWCKRTLLFLTHLPSRRKVWHIESPATGECQAGIFV
ncbi:hypothetical protein B4168_0290 [Anoxybacillus flavithermus]|nr:hypothetical protein B4168_0290 [Anoxybacillus flavithermus]OAO83701.1 hypothetical protein GT23_4011 [Parageobacillus thermoglucosidasius]